MLKKKKEEEEVMQRVYEVKEVLRHIQGILPLELFSGSVLSAEDGKLKLRRTYGCHITD